MDFVVDLDIEVVYVVEINPFGKPDGMGTGLVYFDASNSHDYCVLFGEAPFEFRIEESPLNEESYEKMISQEIRSVVINYE